MMEYKRYVAKIEYDDKAGLFHGQVINMRDVITFQGQSVEELRREFAESVEDYLEFCAERGEKPEKPFSGQFVVRMTPALHREIAIAAHRANQSINTWVTTTLQMGFENQLRPSPFRQAELLRGSYTSIQTVIQGHFVSDVAVLEATPTIPRLGAPTAESVVRGRSLAQKSVVFIEGD